MFNELFYEAWLRLVGVEPGFSDNGRVCRRHSVVGVCVSLPFVGVVFFLVGLLLLLLRVFALTLSLLWGLRSVICICEWSPCYA